MFIIVEKTTKTTIGVDFPTKEEAQEFFNLYNPDPALYEIVEV